MPFLGGRLGATITASQVHPKAALQRLAEAEREAATAELARRVLRYLFRARHDQGLRFES